MAREKTRQRLAIRKAFAPKKKKSTETSKNHRWESFTYRVSRLKIAPIQRTREREDERDLEALESHFRIAFDKWRDLNLSDDFSQFARKVDPLCDSLPQVLHHQDRIVELVLEGIENATKVSAEPFLDLVAHLAQDIRAQFEKHLERTVQTVASVAARHQEVEVVEWSFNCLTWLFKYMERILADDICPLYDWLAPYLGRERQKPFVSRFAAESLSFLVKRVAKRHDPIVNFVGHALDDLYKTSQEQDTELYEYSLIALFTEAIKGTPGHLHSRGDAIFKALVQKVYSLTDSASDEVESPIRVVRGVFLLLINHNTTDEAFVPILDSVLDAFNDTPHSDLRTILSSQLLLIATSVRNGNRVSSWHAVLQSLSSRIDFMTTEGPSDHADAANEILVALAMAHQKCPLDVALSFIGVLDKICSQEWQKFFPGFCNLYAEFGTDRFRSLLLPRFQRWFSRSDALNCTDDRL